MSVNIIEEFDNALNATGWTKSLVAQSIHVTQAAVSNWLARGDIPADMLIKLGRALKDYRFSLAIAEYLTGVRVLSDKRLQDTPQARYFSQAKEENDRKKLDPEFTLLLGKNKEDRTDTDRRRVLKYVKELDEEIEEKSNYKAAIMRDWELYIDEEVI
ncbi:hypothetical protein ACNAN0_02340 [Agrilactobacillus fermenti]|uniref:hypothetical protein n=1 Tax=Agrilactobacillus fermenti TaxID=2586909 RepID=UPI001E4CF29B|nr:hypothetical protein [Agrilactobacillus fermenti]MCD2257108.1 hypothetical protein [Agrilactobacillus fermenti]